MLSASRLWLCAVSLFWFTNELLELFTPFLYIVPAGLVFLSIVAVFVWLLVYCIRNHKRTGKRAAYPMLALAGILLLLWAFPFSKAKLQLEHWLYRDQRYQIVQQIVEGELSVKTGTQAVVALPKGKRHLSLGGEVSLYDLTTKSASVGFYVQRLMLTGYTEVVYLPDGCTPYWEGIPLWEQQITVEPLEQNWYCVKRRY